MTPFFRRGRTAIDHASHTDAKDARVQQILEVAGAIALLLAPLAVAVGWALNYSSIGAFFDFAFESPYLRSGRSASTEQMLQIINDPSAAFRFLFLPHYFVYAAMPVFIAAALAFARVLRRTAPWHGVVGAALTTVGAVYFVGVLGAWLSFPAIADVSADQVANQLPFLVALTNVKGLLLVSTLLSTLVFLGMIVLGCGLYASRIAPRWSAGLVILGNVIVLAFAGTENWMVLGSVLMLIGLLPVSARLIHAAPWPIGTREASS